MALGEAALFPMAPTIRPFTSFDKTSDSWNEAIIGSPRSPRVHAPPSRDPINGYLPVSKVRNLAHTWTSTSSDYGSDYDSFGTTRLWPHRMTYL